MPVLKFNAPANFSLIVQTAFPRSIQAYKTFH